MLNSLMNTFNFSFLSYIVIQQVGSEGEESREDNNVNINSNDNEEMRLEL